MYHFLKYALCLLLMLSAFQVTAATDKTDLPECELVRVDLAQVVIAYDGFFMLNEDNTLVSISGLIHHENELYAITSLPLKCPRKRPRSSTFCTHPYGCKSCSGCCKSDCWNYCPGCTKGL